VAETGCERDTRVLNGDMGDSDGDRARPECQCHTSQCWVDVATVAPWCEPGIAPPRANGNRKKNLVPQTSYLVPRTSCLVPRAPCPVPRASYLVPRASCLVPRTSYLVLGRVGLCEPGIAQPRANGNRKNLVPRTSYLVPRTSHLAPRTSHLAPRTSHLAPRTSHLAPRTSYLHLGRVGLCERESQKGATVVRTGNRTTRVETCEPCVPCGHV
jgi:hypothetical protein